jgi:hypothetical protein
MPFDAHTNDEHVTPHTQVAWSVDQRVIRHIYANLFTVYGQFVYTRNVALNYLL